MTRLLEGLRVDVGGVDLDAVAEVVLRQRLGEQHREAVGLLAGRASRVPDADRLVGGLPADDRRDDLVAEVLPDLLVTEEGGDVDQDEVEQRRELVRMDLEVVQVFGVRVDADELHPFVDPAPERRALVPGEVEPATVPQELQERLEHPVVAVGHRSRIVAVGHRCSIVVVGHRCSTPFTNVRRAPAISSSGSTKSTQPVWIAAPGIPKNSEVASSCAITEPPIFLIARIPIDPSLPVPVRTTASARSRKTAATDSNSRSAEGRRKCTSSELVSDSVRSGTTRRWRSGGAMNATPGCRPSPSSAFTTFSSERLL